MRNLLLACMLALSLPAWAGRREVPLPDGFFAMDVGAVVGGPQSPVVLLTDDAETLVVPISVGPSEALAISLRADRRRFARPLTHDLLDTLVERLDGEIVQVRVDGLRHGTFVASLLLRDGRRLERIDARASDAIALALGRELTIWVADEVVREAAVRREDVVQPEPVAMPRPIEHL